MNQNSGVLQRALAPDPGSFRDPSGQIYSVGGKILRGVNHRTADILSRLLETDFFRDAMSAGTVVQTQLTTPPANRFINSFSEATWARFVEHEAIPFITYPYEWTFAMLRDAALLQLELLSTSLEHQWILKDASPYNIQWKGAHPIFIDVASFEPREDGQPWIAYRQFCAMFLIPLMLKHYLKLDHTMILRSRLDGVSAAEVAALFRGMARFRRGVLSHIILPAAMERSIARRERDDRPAKSRIGTKQSETVLLALFDSLRRLIDSMKPKTGHTAWSQYTATHTYSDADLKQKAAFVERHTRDRRFDLVWDLGSNTGDFSRICAPVANTVIALDSDHDAVERLYLAEKEKPGSNILPLVMDLSNLSPAQGWAGQERMSFVQRSKPDLLLCLALVHHLRISANIPTLMILDWIRNLGCEVIIEFVDRHDEMVEKLLTNKTETYDDYTRASFEAAARERFTIRECEDLKGGKRAIYMLSPA